MKIYQIISTISFLNDTMVSIMNQLKPLFARIHHCRIRSLLGQMKTNTAPIKAYLNIHITQKLTPSITNPIYLRQELLKINKQLPARHSLPENPHRNIWHYYRFLTFLTVSPVTHGNKLVLMIRIPLTDLDSGMNLYKIYNLPIYNHHIGKSLKYLLEGTNLAIAKDNKYATTLFEYVTILSDMEFIR